MILHIPHSATYLPESFSVSSKTDLQKEFERMTDWFTDELFDIKNVTKLVSKYSRLYCDMERYRDDKDESMAQKGMGVCYEKNSFGRKLRDISEDEKEFIKSTVYDAHHKELERAVEDELSRDGKAFIVDCHSFSNEPLPHEDNQQRPDFCIGTDSFHTPDDLTQLIVDFLTSKGFSVLVNEPFAGTIVPLKFYAKEKNVISVMIEVNRKLYLDENFKKNDDFERIKRIVQELLHVINMRIIQ